MTNYTDLTGLAGVAFAMAALAMLLLRSTLKHANGDLRELNKGRCATLFVALLALMMIPINGMSLVAYVRGITGEMSITTIVLIGFWLTRYIFNLETSDNRERLALLMGISLAAMLLYPMALGATALDPYRWGYGEPLFVAVLLLAASIAWYKSSSLIAVSVSLAVLAWGCRWYESDNLWDYLLDPFVAVYALLSISYYAAKDKLKRAGIKRMHA